MRYLLILPLVLLLSGCSLWETREESKAVENNVEQTEGVKHINETYDLNLTFAGQPVTGTLTRSVEETSSKEKVGKKETDQSKKTTVEMPPEFKQFMALMTNLGGKLTQLATGLPTSGLAKTFTQKIFEYATTPEGMATTGTSTALAVGAVGVAAKRHGRKREEKGRTEAEEEANEKAQQLVEGVEKYLKDETVPKEDKEKLLDILSKKMDKSTKDWVKKLKANLSA